VLTRMLEEGEGTFLVKRAEGSFVARMPLADHPEHIAVLSSDPNRSALWHRIAEEQGTTDPDAIWAEYRTRFQEANA
jgi:type IV secretion system protein VirB4